MPYQYSQHWSEEQHRQRLLNLGLFYTLVLKSSGSPVSFHRTLEDAKRAKTRKTRVVLTRKTILTTENTSYEQNEGLAPRE